MPGGSETHHGEKRVILNEVKDLYNRVQDRKGFFRLPEYTQSSE